MVLDRRPEKKLRNKEKSSIGKVIYVRNLYINCMKQKWYFWCLKYYIKLGHRPESVKKKMYVFWGLLLNGNFHSMGIPLISKWKNSKQTQLRGRFNNVK